MKKIYIFGLMVCGFAACKPTIEPIAPESGDADFSSYLAVGDYNTAGFRDGSLYLDGQMNSFANILADQLKTVGGGTFKQPLVPGEHGWPLAKKVLGVRQGPCDTVATIQPVDFSGALDTVNTSDNIAPAGPYNNIGVPGMRTVEYLLNGYAALNPFAARFFKNPMTSNGLDQLTLINNSFFTLWVGQSDIMNYAVAGGAKHNTLAPNEMLPLTPAFYTAYDSLLSTLTRSGAKGVVFNIPSIYDMPFFTTISPRSLTLTEAQVRKLNLAYNGTQVTFQTGFNSFVIEDKNYQGGFRQMGFNELVLLTLPMDSVKCAGWGSTKPIPSQYVLTQDEIDDIMASIQNYNEVINNRASAYSLPVVDLNTYYRNLNIQNEPVNGVKFSSDYASGGIFSLDGFSLTGKGNALIVNQTIMTINNFYKSSIATVDPNKYEGVRYP